MSVLVLYSTKSGATCECAELLVETIPNSSSCNLAKQTPDIHSFETIVIGSGVRMGKIYRPVRKFIENNLKTLLSKKIAFYLCNSYFDTTNKAIENNIPKSLLDIAICIKSFGGKPAFRSRQNKDWIIKENVNAFVLAITNANK